MNDDRPSDGPSGEHEHVTPEGVVLAGPVGEAGAAGPRGERGAQGAAGTDLTNELRAVRADVGRLATAVVSLGADDRLERAVTAVSEEDRRHRQRLLVSVIGVLILVLGMAGFAAWQAHANSRSLDNTEVVADYVRDCLQNRETLTAEQARERCGSAADGGASAVLGIFAFEKCVHLIPPNARTEADLDGCEAKAVQVMQGTPPSTTTTSFVPSTFQQSNTTSR